MQKFPLFLVLSLCASAALFACGEPKQTAPAINAIQPHSAQTNPQSLIDAQTATNTEPVAKSANATPEKTNNPEVIHFAGFGPAKFGDNEESVRMSWGRPMSASKPDEGATCYYLYIDPKPEHGRQIAFMLEDAKFVRYDVDDAKWVAPGNIVVGDSAEKVLKAHAGRVEIQPHKYVQGAQTLIVTPAKIASEKALSHARLIFETDVQHNIINWRIGVEPQIYYVEGCG